MAQDELADRAPYPRFLGDGRIEFRELPVPRPGPGQLLLKVRANALCGTDRAQFLGGSAVTPGHEAAGVVVAAGAGTHTAAGTPGVVYLMEFCGNCRSCRRDATNQCLAKRADMGFDRDGGYGPYELISESIFFSVEASLPLTEATLLLDLMGTSGHALDRALAVRSDIESTLITGAGPVGLGLLAMARLRFGADVPAVVTDLVPYRRSLAQRLGGIPLDGALELRTELARVGIADVDLAIDSTGRPASGSRPSGRSGSEGCSCAWDTATC